MLNLLHKFFTMKSVFIAAGVLLSTSLIAQQKEGTIIYERKQNMHRSISEEMKAFVPEFRNTKQMLVFNEVSSIYKTIPEDEAPEPFSNGGGIVMRFGGGSNDETYFHFTEGKKLSSRDVLGEQFLITDSVRKEKWKLSEETKTIAGHACRKASLRTKIAAPTMRVSIGGAPGGNQQTQAPQEKEVDVIAWYAEDILAPAGPDNYNGLPGVIMELDIDNGGTVFSALEVQTKADAKMLKEPKKGKKVTPEGFRKALNEIMQNMGPGGMRLGGGR
jgi:GLPGLI family protein